MGARRCASGSCARSSAASRIQDRLDAVEELAFRTVERGPLRARRLRSVQDLDRIIGRVTLGTASPRDLAGAGPLAARAARRRRARSASAQAPLVAAPGARTLRAAARRGRGHREQRSSTSRRPPLRDGGVIRDGVDPELDELREISQRRPHHHRRHRGARARAHRHRLAQGALQPRVRLLHRGQQVEPGAGARRLHPQADDRRRRALRHPRAEGVRGARCCRPTSASLAREARALRGAARARGRGGAAACSRPRARWPRSTCSPRLAEVACRHDYVKPRLTDGDELAYVEGRHPVMERLLPRSVRGQRPAHGRAARRGS